MTHFDDAYREREYNEDYDMSVKAISRYGPGDVTYSNRLGSYVRLEEPEEKTRLFNEFTYNAQPVYIVGTTNNKRDFDEATRNVYVQLRREGKEAMLGQWTNRKGVRYRDVIFVISGISREQALKYKKQYVQIAIV